MEKLHGTLQGAKTLTGSLSSSNETLNGKLSEPTARTIHDYDLLENKPKIENVELNGNKSFQDLGLNALENLEIESIFN